MYLWFDGSGNKVGQSRTDIGLDFGFETTKIEVSDSGEGRKSKLVDDKVVYSEVEVSNYEKGKEPKLVDGKVVYSDPVEVAEDKDAMASMLITKNRRAAYPSIEDQLDKIYHEGLDAWKADIKAVKDANPKG